MNPKDFLTTLDKRAAQDNQNAKDQSDQNLSVANTQAIIDTIGQAVRLLLKFQAQHQPKVSVTNQKLPTSIKTPDFKLIVDALDNLKQPLQENKPDDTKIVEAIGKLNESILKLPTSFPEIPEGIEEVRVKNQPDYTEQFGSLEEAIKSIDVKPVVNVPQEAPDDYTPIVDTLTAVIQAVKSIKIPTIPTTDLTPLIDATNTVTKSISDLHFPVANYILPFKNIDGEASQAPIPLIDKSYDYIGFTIPDSNDNYQVITFNSGGSGGTIVRTLGLTYDANSNVTSIART